jgi:hypothetical protein
VGDLVPEGGTALDVEPGGRLVEEEHPRPVQQRQGEVQPALHPAGVAADLAVGGVREPDALDQLVAALRPVGPGHAVQGTLEAHVLPGGQVRVQGRLLERGADRVAHRGAVLDDVVTGDPGRTRGGREEGGEHVHGGRLTGAVGSEEAVDLARAHFEVDSVDGADVALEHADQPVDLDSVGLRLASVPAWHPDSPSGQRSLGKLDRSIHRYLNLANVDCPE